MATFGRVDSGLPYLTQFYQLEVPASDSIEELQKSDLVAFLNMDRERAGQVPVEFSGYGGGKRLIEFAQLHRLITPLMDALADDKDVDAPVVQQIEDMLNEQETRNTLMFPEPVPEHFLFLPGMKQPRGAWVEARHCKAEERIPVTKIRLWPGRLSFPPAKEQILQELRSVFAFHDEDRATITRCEECSSPYLVTRRSQRFCSHRCHDRAGKRRRRAERKNVLSEV